MKKVTYLFLAVLLLGGTVSCKKDVTEVNNYYVNQVFSDVYSIPVSAWAWDNASQTYYCNIQISQIDNVIYNYGGVLVYLSFDNKQSYNALPETYGGVEYSVVHYLGGVRIEYRNSSTYPQGTIYAKVILLDAAEM